MGAEFSICPPDGPGVFFLSSHLTPFSICPAAATDLLILSAHSYICSHFSSYSCLSSCLSACCHFAKCSYLYLPEQNSKQKSSQIKRFLNNFKEDWPGKKKSLLHKSLVFILAQRRELKSVGESVEEPRLQMKEEKLHLKEKKKRKRATKN